MTNRKGLCRAAVAALIAAALALGAAGEASAQMAGGVQRAYELRMAGRADDARILLAGILARDPADAEARYEMARTQCHIGFGRVEKLFDMIDEADDNMTEALALDPGNPAYRLFAAQLWFLKSYIALQREPELAKPRVGRLCRNLRAVLDVAPEHYPSALRLVELYSVLPPEMGGDRERAEELAAELEGCDEVWGARARCLLLDEEADRVAFWREVHAAHPENAVAAHELGRALLMADRHEEGEACLREAITLDACNNCLTLDIARYHLMRAMHDEKWVETGMPRAEQALYDFLATSPPAPLRAYALCALARVRQLQDEGEEAEKLMREAEGLDPYYSRASGVPAAELYAPPGEMAAVHRYMFRPF